MRHELRLVPARAAAQDRRLSLTPAQIGLVQSTWKHMLPIRDTFAELFYGKLFELDPATRRLFHNDLAAQGRKIMTMLDAVVSSLDRFDATRERLRDLGRQHAGYGVKPGDYDTVIAALTWTFAQALGADFDAAAREAWRIILTEISETMRSSLG